MLQGDAVPEACQIQDVWAISAERGEAAITVHLAAATARTDTADARADVADARAADMEAEAEPALHGAVSNDTSRIPALGFQRKLWTSVARPSLPLLHMIERERGRPHDK